MIFRPPSPQTPPPSELIPFSWKLRTVLNQMKNHFSIFKFLSYGWLCLQFTGDTRIFKCVTDYNKKNMSFINGQIYRKYAQWAETNEKSIFWFLFFEILYFLYSKLVNFSMNSKNKNFKYRKIDFSFVPAHCAYFL